MSRILVLGATGTVGRPTVKALLAMGEDVKAASRGGQAVDGADGVVFDFDRPDTIALAFEDVDRAFILLPSGSVDAQRLLLPVVQSAISRKVKVVFQSVLGVEADDSNPYRQAELALQHSNVPFVVLRPNWFADNFHKYWKAGIDHSRIAVPAGDGRSSFIDARDIAASAAVALSTDAFDGRVFNLTGPEALSYSDAATVLSEVLARRVSYTHVDDDTFIDMLSGAGMPRDYAVFLASIFHPVRAGWTARVNDDVETMTGYPPRSLRTYALDHLADFG